MGGGDKPLLERRRASRMIARIIAALDAVPDRDQCQWRSRAVRRASACRCCPTARLPVEGPLAGLLAGLDWAAGLGADALLTVPGDTPFIPRGLAAALAPAPACAASNGRAHHLVALWPVACRDDLRRLLVGAGAPRRCALCPSHRHAPG